MKYYSIFNKTKKVNFQKSVIQGLAADKGLYFPENIPVLNPNFIKNIAQYSNDFIAFEVIKSFIGDVIPEKELKQIIAETLSFDFPVVEVEKGIYATELYHGPTLAFKDVGARFMSRCIGYFNQNKKNQKVTILVATSGDTGSAVANGFLNVEGVEVVILYPSKKVSVIQEKQLTTLGQNITALEVTGTFDDCQNMVKKAFLDDSFKGLNLTSANSINIARWLAQMFYFFITYKKIKLKGEKIVFSVPSGNFGNICAGLMAKKIGLPIDHFVAATNSNDTIPRFMNTGKYEPLSSKETISNAMDVGNPSNFIRIQELYQNNFEQLKREFSSYSFDDVLTKKALQSLYKEHQYLADPHGTVGYLGLKKFLKNKTNYVGVFFETAHPIKFLDTVEEILDIKIDIPDSIANIMNKEKNSIQIKSYQELKLQLLKFLNT